MKEGYKDMTNFRKYLLPALWIGAFETVSFTIGRVTQPGVEGWYTGLVPPPLTPPNIVFPIVWTTLYAMLAVAGWILWTRREQDRRLLNLFAVYMIMNWGWSFLFFSLHWLFISFAWIVALNLVSLVLIVAAWRTARPAAWLIIPTMVWTCFAAYLAGGYWLLN